MTGRLKDNPPQQRSCALLLVFAAALTLTSLNYAAVQNPAPLPAGISKAASDSCAAKVDRLQKFAEGPVSKKKQVTQFSEDEINSYLAIELSPRYHPSLKSLVVKFEEAKLQAVAIVDFDQLSMKSTSTVTRMLARLFSGTHTMTMRGTVRTNAGKGNFELEQARFDDSTLPNFLVEEIISAVGRKQKPPFDPLQPTQMPYRIQKVDLHPGYIVVHQ